MEQVPKNERRTHQIVDQYTSRDQIAKDNIIGVGAVRTINKERRAISKFDLQRQVAANLNHDNI